ncbi:MAG: histidine phosphatase family protein [Deltaproteobacteria bacterium]|nr:histidine phosphatase family protein [Deltaproteobacteria bacterium]MBT7710931.1 histidine phosphatase family protein [Deltaproteobacteria bacterium]
MPKIYLVRHGKAAAGWDADPDPGLDDLGRKQSIQATESLAPVGPLDIVSSPLARTRETAIPLAELWQRTPRIETRVAEIPSPTEDLSERAEWLRGVMGDIWTNQSQELLTWRQGIIDALYALEKDTVIFSHFIAINAIAGKAAGDERVVGFLPDNGSITIIETRDNGILMVERGIEAGTKVN